MKKSDSVKKLAFAAILAALSFVAFNYIAIPISADLKIHLGNAFVVLGALILGGPWGGLAGAVGLTLADLTGGFVMYAPTTFICKLIMGLITGLFAHKIAGINEAHDKKYTFRWSLISSAAALACNTVIDPFITFLWDRLIFKNAEAVLALRFGITAANAVTNTILAVVLYMSLRPALKRMQII